MNINFHTISNSGCSFLSQFKRVELPGTNEEFFSLNEQKIQINNLFAKINYDLHEKRVCAINNT